MKDGWGRDINYIRISVTDRCNLRCIYCMPLEGVEKKEHDDILRHEDILKIVKCCAKLGINKIRLTGGEPLIVKDIDRLIYEISKVEGIYDIGITTNGILLKDMAGDLKKCGLKRVNISLDTLDEEKFKKITRRGQLKNVLDAIEECLRIGLSPVKINTVLIRGINDNEIEDIMNLTRKYPLDVRFIELMPIGEGEKYYKDGFISSEEIIKNHKSLIPLGRKKGETAENYKLSDAIGKIGFISPLSCKFCDSCNRIRLTSTGTIKPCLHSEKEYSIREYLNSEDMLLMAIKNSILNKPKEHYLEENEKSFSKKMMFQIGG
ncbi:cyclic pyranopterin monophosphate synthase subunit MoaA [Caloramator quimbayensis]|uniref:GTP 3',8-cyclase n=1 Tax=Caloramator quimbayensis TaxID=1147123 RepID=A0A1T4XZM8_9CLOT|nr:GTP 3',8-cyclase MoaA [Caloramator quimbayensis]SKA95024.1 cyclic pyranopterin monophosphate synthase subunit MoaA [Caloramator quimbayensis]